MRSAISSLGSFSTTALGSSYILFHETIVTGLNALTLLYSNITEFKEFIEIQVSAIKRVEGFAVPQLEADAATVATLGIGKVGKYLSLEDDNFVIPKETQGSENDVTGANINALLGAWGDANDKQKEQLKEIFCRFGLKQGEMFNDFINALYSHGSCLHDLVNIKIDVDKSDNIVDDTSVPKTIKYGDRKMLAYIDYSGMREKAHELFYSLKTQMDKFKGLLPKKVIDDYQNGDKEGSLYWLEKHFIDELLEGKYEDHTKSGISSINQDIKKITDYFTKPWGVTGHTVDNAHRQATNALKLAALDTNTATLKEWATADREIQAGASGKKIQYHQFTNEFEDLCIYKLSYMPTDNSGVVAATSGISSLMFNTSGKNKNGIQSTEMWKSNVPPQAGPAPVPATYNRIHNLYSAIKGENFTKFTIDFRQKGLVLSFNRLLAEYINCIYDNSSRCVYLPSINKFASGTFNSAIIGDNNYDDQFVQPTLILESDGTLPQTKGILFKTIAIMIKQLVTEKNSSNTDMEFAKVELSSIPNYLKENMRANLPIFNKMFKLLVKKAELIKKFASVLDTARPSAAVDGGGNNKILAATLQPKTDSDANSKHILNICDQVIKGSYGLTSCIQDVLNDLGDSPRYFEMNENFISEYENINGKSPFMPQSSVMYMLNANPSANDAAANALGLPVHQLGSTNFKFNYGTRKILNEPSNLSDLPGMKVLIKNHNNSTDPKNNLSEDEYKKLSGSFMPIMQYLINSRVYRYEFVNWIDATNIRYMNDRKDHFTIDTKQPENWVFQLRSSKQWAKPDDVIRLTDSSSYHEQENKIIKHVESGTDDVLIQGVRSDLRVYNIIDMNIVPLNVHALMREIPLINLYNYSYTFDSMVCGLFPGMAGVSFKEFKDKELSFTDANNPVKTAEQLMALMLIYPYKKLDEATYEYLFSRIMRGGLGVQGLGRPKYLGDEIYNKALFGEIISKDIYEIEPSPGLAHAHEQGKKEVVFDHRGFTTEFMLKYLDQFINTPTMLAIYTEYKPLVVEFLRSMKNYTDLANLGEEWVDIIAARWPKGMDRAQAAAAKISDLMVEGQNLITMITVLTFAVYKILAPAMSKINTEGLSDTARIAAIQAVIAAISDTYFRSITTGITPQGGGGVIDFNANSRINNTALAVTSLHLRTGNQVNYTHTSFSNLNNMVGIAAIMAPLANSVMMPDHRRFSRQVRLAAFQNKKYFSSDLHYLEADAKGKYEIKSVALKDGVKDTLKAYGKLRFDTKLVRNLVWLTNIQRVMRLKLRKDLTWYNSKVVSDHASIASSVTELYSKDMNVNPNMYNYKY